MHVNGYTICFFSGYNAHKEKTKSSEVIILTVLSCKILHCILQLSCILRLICKFAFAQGIYHGGLHTLLWQH